MSVTTTSKHEAFIASILGESKNTFSETRQRGLHKLETVSFPTLRSEVWKYTRVSGLLNKQFTPQKDVNIELPENIKAIVENQYSIVFVNGFFNADLSTISEIAGLHISVFSSGNIEENSMAHFATSWDGENEAFTHLNEASFTDGIHIKVHANTHIEQPIYIVNLVHGELRSAAKRSFIEVEKSAQASFINLYESDENTSFSNHFTSLIIGENAHVNWYDYHNESQAANHIHTTIGVQQANSNVNIGSYLFGGKLIRKNFYMNVEGSNAQTTVNGSYLLNNKQVADHRVIIDHKAANCESNQTFKGVMSGKSSGIFNGKIYVRRDAQVINAFQSNNNILLSDDANAYSRPQLEIYADDVKCSHGSTIGQLDQEALFYLMARGIRRQEAEKLLVGAFTADAIENIHLDSFKEVIEEAMANKTAKL